MSYKLKFYCLGTPTRGQNYKIYLRYYYLNKTLSIPTNYTLSKDQVELVNKGEYGGGLQTSLDNIRAGVIKAVETLNLINNGYPSPATLKAFYIKIENALPMEMYVNNFLGDMEEIKDQSKRLYVDHLKHWTRYYNLNLTKIPIGELIHKETIQKFGRWLVDIGKINKKKVLKPSTMHNIKHTAFRLLNYIAEQQHQKKIDNYLVQPKTSIKFTPTDEQLQALVGVDIEGTVNPRKLRTLRIVKDLVYVNSFWGLRISDLVNIKIDNINTQPNHISVRFLEQKSGEYRYVVLLDKKGIEIVKHYIYQATDDFLWKIGTTTFNDLLKDLAELCFGDKTTYLYDVDKSEEKPYIIRKVISSHCIRRYAITRNINLYGIDVARSFSGHSNYETVVKHYSKGWLSEEVALSKMLGRK